MNGKLLMFELNSLPVIAAVNQEMEHLGVEVIPVMPKDYNKSIQSLAEKTAVGADDTEGRLGGSMLVLCGLEKQLDDVLPALRTAGVGVDCLKAVMTVHNRKWTARELHKELLRERMAVTGK